MRHRRTILTHALVGSACALAVLPQTTLAEPVYTTLEGVGFDEVVSRARGNNRDPFAPEEGHPLPTQEDQPAYFDLRDVEEEPGFRKANRSGVYDRSVLDTYEKLGRVYQLKESSLLPSPASIDSDEAKAETIAAIKGQLLAGHAVSINLAMADALDMLGQNCALYNDYAWPSNRVVTIVGYDDAYPQENFSTQPPYDGAWLVEVGEDADGVSFGGLYAGQDVPGSGYEATSDEQTGCIWVSYYDRTIRDPEAYRFVDATPGLIIDQHDCLPVSTYGCYTTETPAKTANILVASRSERLESVSFVTTTPGTTVTYQVFLLADNAASPEGGTCVFTSTPKQYDLGGSHREELSEPITMRAGQRYAIVVEQRTPSGKYSVAFNEFDTMQDESLSWLGTAVNSRESYLFVDGAWTDLSDDAIRSILEDETDGLRVDSFSIKGYASPVAAEPIGESTGDTDVARNLAGKLEIVSGQLAEEDRTTVFSGNPYEPEPIEVKATGESPDEVLEVVKDVDYQVTYENNVMCGKGEAIITGIGDYEGEIRDSADNHLSFIIVPTKATITRVTPGVKKLTVRFLSQESTGISGYMLSYNEHGSSETQQIPVAKDATSVEIADLTPGKTYDVSLVAYVTTTETDPETGEESSVNHVGERSTTVTSTPVLNERTPEEEKPGTEDPEKQDPATQTYIVTFDTVGGTALKSQAVVAGRYAVAPAKPIKKGYTFKGWRLVGKNGSVAATDFDFKTTPITSDITLRAQWEETEASKNAAKSTTTGTSKSSVSSSATKAASSTTSTSGTSSSSTSTTSESKLPSTGDTTPATLPFGFAGLGLVVAGVLVRVKEAWRA